MYGTGSQIRFKTSMLRLSLWDYSNEYIPVSGRITIVGHGADDAEGRAEGTDKEI